MPEKPEIDAAKHLLARMEANAEASQEAMAAANAEPTVMGSTGQPRANPLFNVARECDELALRLSQELRELRKLREADTIGLTGF
ncbi:MAG: hypothetical protein ACRDK1_00625 [Solirubrobacterales bacterium]